MSLTPQQLFDQLVAELSASGAVPLVDADGTHLTLREAVERLLWKETFLLTVADRPVPPTTADDQYGHVLSTHAVALQNQALLAALAAKQGIDVGATLAAATASFK